MPPPEPTLNQEMWVRVIHHHFFCAATGYISLEVPKLPGRMGP
jgi:hypothetical protein